jgi:hypothetical protein
MQSLLQKIEDLDVLIRDLHKIESMQRSGQFILANREILRIIAYLERSRKSVIEDADVKTNDQ